MKHLQTLNAYQKKLSAFQKGLGLSIDAFGTLSQPPQLTENPNEMDNQALWNDWKVVGADLVSAILKYEQTKPNPKTNKT